MKDDSLIPAHGGYRQLKTFQLAELIYDLTTRFCDRYISARSRTHDQMVQAARSGMQNIAEGSQASGTSKKMELKLTNVARASLEELRQDYEAFLRQKDMPLWDKQDPLRKRLVVRRCKTADDVARWVKEIGDELNGQDGRDGLDGQKPSVPNQRGKSNQSIPSIKSISSINPKPQPQYPPIAANAALVLIGVCCALLDRQLAAQAKAFEDEGGFTERLYRKLTERRKQDQ